MLQLQNPKSFLYCSAAAGTNQCQQNQCLAPGQVMCGTTVCGVGQTCQGGTVCCDSTATFCNNACCPNGNACVNNQCVPQGSVPCGTTVCQPNTICGNPSTGGVVGGARGAVTSLEWGAQGVGCTRLTALQDVECGSGCQVSRMAFLWVDCYGAGFCAASLGAEYSRLFVCAQLSCCRSVLPSSKPVRLWQQLLRLLQPSMRPVQADMHFEVQQRMCAGSSLVPGRTAVLPCGDNLYVQPVCHLERSAAGTRHYHAYVWQEEAAFGALVNSKGGCSRTAAIAGAMPAAAKAAAAMAASHISVLLVALGQAGGWGGIHSRWWGGG